MIPLILGGLSFAGSLLGGIGGAQAAKKQAKMQAVQDMITRQENAKTLAAVNQRREELGREMLTIPEVHTRSTSAASGNWVDVDGMMAAAERAGFNPTTWLNAGGMQAYAQAWSTNDEMTTSTGHNAADAFKLMMPEYALAQASQVPQQQSMLSAFGGALSAGANAFGTQYRADQSYDVQLARVMAGQANQSMGLSGSNGLSTALQFGGGGLGGDRAVSSRPGGVSDLPYPTKWEQGKTEVTNPFRTWSIDSSTADAETYETRYGDLAQEVFGASNLAQDSVRNVTGKSIRDWGVLAGMNIGDYTTKTDNSYLGTIGRWWNSPTSIGGYLRSPPKTLPYIGSPM